MLSIIGCGRSDFEGLLQQYIFLLLSFTVVEGPILRDYYNLIYCLILHQTVVEGPILRDYYNLL